MIELADYQLRAIDQMKNGSILAGGVGSGKSVTAIAYYILKVCNGNVKIQNYGGQFMKMEYPRDLYIITTAKKRDSLEWEGDLSKFALIEDEDFENAYKVKVTIDSWNNIRKYKDVFGAFFIFDEQRVVGSGIWVKTFLNIARKNKWILLSATPGDVWSDYIPVFIANGFYKNKSEFQNLHCVFSRNTKYPKIERYVGEQVLERYRDNILVPMADNRKTHRNKIYELADYDEKTYKIIYIKRWDPYEDQPIEEASKWCYLQRLCVNSDHSRIEIVDRLLKDHKKVIIFYNHSYELKMLRDYLSEVNYVFSEWNGKKHQEVPEGESWVYLVQYSAGCEGWNCITTDTIIFYSQSYSYRMTEQAAGRIDRMNTPYKELYYYYIKSRSPIDLAIYKALKNKKRFNERSFGRFA